MTITLYELQASPHARKVRLLASELGIPVKLIGVGEKLEDLRPFDPEEYASALLAE